MDIKEEPLFSLNATPGNANHGFEPTRAYGNGYALNGGPPTDMDYKKSGNFGREGSKRRTSNADNPRNETRRDTAPKGNGVRWSWGTNFLISLDLLLLSLNRCGIWSYRYSGACLAHGGT
jgi:hypothetical protein